MNRLDELLAKRTLSLSPGGPFRAEAAEDDDGPLCPICGGAGRVRREFPRDHPGFGKAEPCECVLDEAEEVRATRLQRLSNLGSLARFTFDTWNPGPGPHPNPPPPGEGVDRISNSAAIRARDYAANPDGWLVLSGPSGTGKTHLAAAIANERILLAQPVLFMVVPDLLDLLRASYDPEDEELNFSQLFEQVKGIPFLVLDDIDAAAGTPWAREKLFQVINHRYNAQLPTVFTTSQPPDALDDRLRTRLGSGEASVISLAPAQKGLYLEVGGMTAERLAEMRFGDFHDRPDLEPASAKNLSAARRVAEVYAENPDGWLVIHGPFGCGKTHLAAAIAVRAVARGETVFFAIVPDLLDLLRSAFDPANTSPRDEAFNQMRTAQLLVLDDLGAHKTSAWAEEKLYQLVNYRTLSRLPTVVTTNLRPDEIAKSQPRLYSRMLDRDGTLIEIVATSYRGGKMDARWAGKATRQARR